MYKPKRLNLLIILLSIASFLFVFSKLTTPTRAATTHIVISEVQIAGTGGASEDFVELYNPTDTPYDLDGHRLVKRTASGTSDTSLKSWSSETIIPAHGYYLWANSSWTTAVIPDASTAATIAANNGVALRQGASDTGTIIDSVAWGAATNEFVEVSTYPDNPAAGESLERVGDDTDNNGNDFIIQTSPNPQNSSSSVTPTPTGEASPTPTEEPSPTPTGEPSTSGDIVINEIAWAGTVASANGEWIELYNNTSSTVDLTGWTLKSTDGAPDISLDGTIPGNGYFLLERSDDSTVSDITADQIYTGSLGNTGESLELRDVANLLVDTANGDGGSWPAGNSTDRTSMERVNPTAADTDDNWATNDAVYINGVDADSNNILGSPKSANITTDTLPSPTPTEEPSPTPTEIVPTPTQEPSPTPTSTPKPTPTFIPSPPPFVLGFLGFGARTKVCTFEYRIKQLSFFWIILPKVTCHNLY